MGTDRTWTIRKDAPSSSMPFDSFQASILGPNTDNVSVVEEARLREAEAELHRAQEIQADEYKQRVEAEARVERLEAELREARAILSEIANFTIPEKDSDCRLDLEDARDRARSVLEKGESNA